MNGVNIMGIMAGIAAIVAFAMSCRMLRGKKAATRTALLFIFSLLSLPSLFVAVYYLRLPLEYAWFYEMRSWRGSEFLIVFAGCAAGAAATFLPRLLLVLPLSGLLGVAAIPYLKPVLLPLADADFHEEWKNGACIQSTSSTGGPASISTILKKLGSIGSEKDAARAVHTYQNGTEAWYLARYVRSKGFKARFDFHGTFSPTVELPAVVGVKLGNIGHFIPVLAVEPDHIVIADPLRGEERLPLHEFHRRYGFTGFHMLISEH